MCRLPSRPPVASIGDAIGAAGQDLSNGAVALGQIGLGAAAIVVGLLLVTGLSKPVVRTARTAAKVALVVK